MTNAEKYLKDGVDVGGLIKEFREYCEKDIVGLPAHSLFTTFFLQTS